MRVAVYAICRDEERHAGPWLDAVLTEPVDVVVIVDTGSTDGTWATLTGRTDPRLFLARRPFDPWRFDVARNHALDLVPRDVDAVLSLDFDERMSPGWVDAVHVHWLPGRTRRAWYRYEWSARHAFTNGDIHARHGARWVGPTHETLEFDPSDDPIECCLPGVVMTHHQERGRGRHERDLALLALACRERPNDARVAWYYARELGWAGRRADAAEVALRMLTLPNGWPPERAMAMIVVGDACAAGGRPEAADGWYLRAIDEAPTLREPHVRRAILHAAAGDRFRARAAADAALRISARPDYYLCDPIVWDDGYIRTLAERVGRAA